MQNEYQVEDGDELDENNNVMSNPNSDAYQLADQMGW